MSDVNQTKRLGSTPRGVKIVLALSLAVNLLVVGTIGGLALQGGGDSQRTQREDLRNMGLGPMGAALSPEHRRELLENARTSTQEIRAERQALARAANEFLEATRSEPFDRALAERSLEMQRDHIQALSERGHLALLDQLEAMSLAEREAFADAVRESLRRRLGPPRSDGPDRRLPGGAERGPERP